MGVLDDFSIRQALAEAWSNSQPGTPDAHEEGGFILRAVDGTCLVERWPKGLQNQILVPPHKGGRRGAAAVLATFHTHPNPGPEFQQEPGLTEFRAVRDDPDLRHPEYEGEYVIASETVYHILPNGHVATIADTRQFLNLP